MSRPAPLFTPRFLTMCAFTFTVFLSAFQLLPTAPFRILDLGGTRSDAGLFLGALTFASAASAPFTGVLADRLGRRQMLIGCGLAICLFSIGYALAGRPAHLTAIAFIHGLFWSGLLSASAAYLTDAVPEARRAEGIGYWGLANVIAVAVAPPVGFAVYAHGWIWLCVSTGSLNLAMAAIAWSLPQGARGHRSSKALSGLVEWRVMALSGTLFLYSFGYGAITSFAGLCATARGIAPTSLYYTSFALVVLVARPATSRLADRVGYRRVLYPCLLLISLGLAVLALSRHRPGMILSAVVFGLGFGAAYPVFVAHVMRRVEANRRGAAFGGILAAFDTGIGAGSIVTGLLVDRFGYSVAFGAAAALSALAPPYFRMVEPRLFRG